MTIDTAALRALLAAVGSTQGTRVQVADGLENIADILDTLADGSADLITDTVTVGDVAYNAGTWDSNNTVPTKNAVRDKIESFNLTTGTWVPTVTLITNFSSGGGYVCYWARVNNIAICSLRVDADTIVAGYSAIEITLPVTTNNFTGGEQAQGVVNAEKGAVGVGNMTVQSVNGTGRARVSGYCDFDNNTAFRGIFIYEIV